MTKARLLLGARRAPKRADRGSNTTSQAAAVETRTPAPDYRGAASEDRVAAPTVHANVPAPRRSALESHTSAPANRAAAPADPGRAPANRTADPTDPGQAHANRAAAFADPAQAHANRTTPPRRNRGSIAIALAFTLLLPPTPTIAQISQTPHNPTIPLQATTAPKIGTPQQTPVTPSAAPTPAAPHPSSSSSPSLTLSLDEALQIALAQNYAIRSTRLDVRNADAQIREAWGQVLPRIDVSSSYTRNLKSANPFAGSEAGGLFSSFGFIDWLSYNEKARTDEDPTTSPISYDEFGDRQREGLEEIGATFGGSDNPFAVPNEFIGGVTIEQTLFSGSAFTAIKAASRIKDINQRALDRREQVLIDDVRQSFYTALLAQEQSDVQRQSVLRTAETLEDVTKRVTQGVAPKFERLTAEVELANLETQLVQVDNQAAQTIDALKMQLGIPIEQPLQLRGELEAQDRAVLVNVSVVDAVDEALSNRPDLEQARLAVELREIDKDITKSQYLPAVSAFANLNYMGRVPDDRTVIRSGDDPFSFTQQTNDFFSKNYWNPSVNAGVRLTWNVFNGFQTSAQVQQKQVAVDQARVDYDQALESVYLEVGNALRSLEAARQRIDSQEQNVARAELNYEYAQQRLTEGVATHLEERNASEQLDLSRLNYLQAVHDYLVARSAFQTAIGKPLTEPSRLLLTSN